MSYLLGHDALMAGTNIVPKPSQRVPLSSRRLSGVRRTSLGPIPSIVKPVSVAAVDALDKENQSMGAARNKRRATINTNNTASIPGTIHSSLLRNWSHSFCSLAGRRISSWQVEEEAWLSRPPCVLLLGDCDPQDAPRVGGSL